jgi:hypothetical protein
LVDLAKRMRGRERLEALRSMYGDGVMLQMVMGLTSGMLQLIAPTALDVHELWQLVGAMSEQEWQMGVNLTRALVEQNGRALVATA